MSLMLQMADQPVLMDVFKRVLAERTKDLRRADKNDPKFMKKHLEDVLKSTIWPVWNEFIVGVKGLFTLDSIYQL